VHVERGPVDIGLLGREAAREVAVRALGRVDARAGVDARVEKRGLAHGGRGASCAGCCAVYIVSLRFFEGACVVGGRCGTCYTVFAINIGKL